MADETTNNGAATEAPPSFYPGLGRRKTAIARLRLIPNGSGTWKINGGRTLEKYFEREQDRSSAASPFEVTSTTGKFDVHVTCSGGGYAGQAGAIRLALSRALCKVSKDHETLLRAQSFLTRDAREKERRKYGRRGARARFQFSKR